MSRNWCCGWGGLCCELVGKEDVGQMRDSGHRVGQSVRGATVVAENLEIFHPGQDVLDASANLAMCGVEIFFPAGKIAAVSRFAKGHDDSRIALVAAIGHYWSVGELLGD